MTDGLRDPSERVRRIDHRRHFAGLDAPKVGYGPIPRDVKDNVVALPRFREVVAGVVDNVVRADRPARSTFVVLHKPVT